MAIPTHKEELIQAIQKNYQMLIRELSTLSPEKVSSPELEGHVKNTSMSVLDLLAYLIGWGELVLKWMDRKEKGLEVDFPESGYKWNQLGVLAQKFYRDYEGLGFEERMKMLESTTQTILKKVEMKSNEALYGIAWYEKYTLGRMIQLNTASPFLNAKNRIRKWKKLN